MLPKVRDFDSARSQGRRVPPLVCMFPSFEMLMKMEASLACGELCDGQICNQSRIFLFRAILRSASLCKMFLLGELSFEGFSNGSSILLNVHLGLRKAGV